MSVKPEEAQSSGRDFGPDSAQPTELVIRRIRRNVGASRDGVPLADFAWSPGGNPGGRGSVRLALRADLRRRGNRGWPRAPGHGNGLTLSKDLCLRRIRDPFFSGSDRQDDVRATVTQRAIYRV
jgi:hypothetical protein